MTPKEKELVMRPILSLVAGGGSISRFARSSARSPNKMPAALYLASLAPRTYDHMPAMLSRSQVQQSLIITKKTGHETDSFRGSGGRI